MGLSSRKSNWYRHDCKERCDLAVNALRKNDSGFSLQGHFKVQYVFFIFYSFFFSKASQGVT